MKAPFRIALVAFVATIAVSWSAASPTTSAGADIDRAAELVDEGQFAFARVYLERALIDPSITAGQRSRGFYLRGYSFFAQDMPVSAAKDYHRALEFNNGNRSALTALAYLHHTGSGVEENRRESIRLYTKAARAGDTASMVVIGRAQLLGEDLDREPNKARHWLGEAANSGHCEAMELMGYSYRAGVTDEPEPEIAREWYDKAINAGCDDTVVALGELYRSGELGKPDPAAAVVLFKEAAQRDNAAAQEALGYAFLHGDGVSRDYGAARRHLEHAAQAGRSAASVGLSYLYGEGLGVKRSSARSERWLLNGARAGNVDAQEALAEMLAQQRRFSEVGHWLREAANTGSLSARVNYSLFLSQVPVVELRDSANARQYAQLAVTQDATSIAALEALAHAHSAAGKPRAAIQTLERAAQVATSQNLPAEQQERLRAAIDALAKSAAETLSG